MPSVLPSYTAPFESHNMISFTPKVISSLQTAIPAAPAPFITTRSSDASFPTILRALIIAAHTTMAVPCWSSWKIGIFVTFLSLDSISKHAGAEISSRFTPPKTGSNNLTALTISSGSLVSRHIGNASTPANALNKTAFPSMTGRPAAAPMSPNPKTAVPLVTTATMFPLAVYSYTLSGSAWISLHGSATPGVYARLRSCLFRTGTLLITSILPL